MLLTDPHPYPKVQLWRLGILFALNAGRTSSCPHFGATGIIAADDTKFKGYK
jgi:hypothetical protein